MHLLTMTNKRNKPYIDALVAFRVVLHVFAIDDVSSGSGDEVA